MDPFPLDQDRPDDLETAVFGLGCFWGPDARFGVEDGVWTTQAGYAGGSRPDPTYRRLGDHTETVRIFFDPATVTYRDLLDIFWAGHDPTVPQKTQYRSVILVAGDEQRRLAEKTLNAQRDEHRGVIQTGIEDLGTFHVAEDYHQKYRLRHTDLMDHFAGMDPDAFRDSTVAARCNGYVAGWGSPDRVDAEMEALGLPDSAIDVLRDRAGTHRGDLC